MRHSVARIPVASAGSAGWPLLLIALALLTVLGSPSPALASGSHRVRAYATYYGWYDNTPPGCGTAYSGCAGGTGTFADAIAFASDPAEFPVGTVVYYPAVRKYFRMSDSCEECTLDWTGRGPDGGPRLRHLDLWIGGRGGSAFDAIDCESALTQSRPGGAPKLTDLIVDPVSHLPVSSQPLFDPASGRCFRGATAPESVGSYRNRSSGRCLADPGHRLGAPAATARCDRPVAQIAFQGAFLLNRRRCLKTSAAGRVAVTFWARCDGDPDEQWEINPNGTITWVQYTRCLAVRPRRIVMTSCDGGAAERWRFSAARRRPG